MHDGRARLRLGLATLGLIAAAWSLLLSVTRGLSFTIGAVHVSSRNARNPALGALVLLALAALYAPAGSRMATVLGDILIPLRLLATLGRRLARAARPLVALATRRSTMSGAALVLSLAILVVSWTQGVYVLGGADSYGYGSLAHLFATGRMRVDVPLAHAFPHVPPDALSPLGYRPADDGTDTLVPMYAPGLPLTMAVAERTAGINAIYAVMPVLAAVAVWSTYSIGLQVAGPAVGLGAALLLAVSPAFLFQLVGAPLSDVPDAGWWALALALLLRERRLPMIVAGVAAGAAILTRPNLLFVVVVPGAYLLWDVLRRPERREPMVRFALFSFPVVVACLGVAAFNASWYGSPLRSGYPAGLFNVSYWDDNIANFSRWISETQTPIFFLGLAAPLAARWMPDESSDRRLSATIMLTGVALAVVASYLFYTPFGAWWFLRFLIPGFPAMAVATCITLAALSRRLGTFGRALAIAAVVGAAGFSLYYVRHENLAAEYRYRLMGEWVRTHLPERALVFSMQHSGSIAYYSGRTTVRYDLVPPADLDAAVNEMIAAGYHPYLVIDDGEIEAVRARHGVKGRAALDWPPIAVLPLGNVRVWDLGEDRDAARASARQPEQVAIPDFIRRRLP